MEGVRYTGIPSAAELAACPGIVVSMFSSCSGT